MPLTRSEPSLRSRRKPPSVALSCHRFEQVLPPVLLDSSRRLADCRPPPVLAAPDRDPGWLAPAALQSPACSRLPSLLAWLAGSCRSPVLLPAPRHSRRLSCLSAVCVRLPVPLSYPDERGKGIRGAVGTGPAVRRSRTASQPARVTGDGRTGARQEPASQDGGRGGTASQARGNGRRK